MMQFCSGHVFIVMLVEQKIKVLKLLPYRLETWVWTSEHRESLWATGKMVSNSFLLLIPLVANISSRIV